MGGDNLGFSRLEHGFYFQKISGVVPGSKAMLAYGKVGITEKWPLLSGAHPSISVLAFLVAVLPRLTAPLPGMAVSFLSVTGPWQLARIASG